MKSFIAALLLTVASVTAYAEPELGAQFVTTPQPIPAETSAKVEVVELFWYGCPHCHHLDPAVNAWVKKLPKDVEFRRVPGVFRPDWVPMAKAYYTLEALNLLEKLHVALFDAIHQQKSLKPNDEAAAIDWITKQSGLDRKKVEETFNSFSVNTKVSRAAQFSKSSGATGVPAIIVDGRFLTSVKLATSALPRGISNDKAHAELLGVTDYLIQQISQEKSGKR